MPALFSRRDDRRLKTIMCALGLGCMSAIATPLVLVRSPINTHQGEPVRQPVPFDHRHHVEDAGIDCLFCHQGAQHNAQASIPAPDVCMRCHNQVWRDAELLAPVRAAAAAGAALPWQRVHRLPSHVHFHHGAHTESGVSCVTCHGHVEQMAAVWQAAPLTMGWCVDCHRDAQSGKITAVRADVDPPVHCSGCHR